MERVPKAKQEPTQNNYEFKNFLFAFIGLFVGLGFSIKSCQDSQTANVLSKKALDLSVSDTLQAGQLIELKKLYKNAQYQIEIQNKQLETIYAQLQTQNKQYSLSSSIAESNRLTNLYKLRNSLQKIDKLMPHQGAAYMKTFDNDKRIEFIDSIKSIVEGELQNPYLTSRSDLLMEWVQMANNCLATQTLVGKLSPQTTFVSDGKGGHAPDSTEIQEIKLKAFSKFVDKFYNFYFYNMDNILFKEYKLLFNE